MFSRFALAMFGPFSTVTIAKTAIAHKKRAIEHADSIARERSRILLPTILRRLCDRQSCKRQAQDAIGV